MINVGIITKVIEKSVSLRKIFVMKRLLISELIRWKNKENRQPLVLKGARQVGKTWLLKHFGETCFEDYVYLNFEKESILASLFERALSPAQIIENLSIYCGKPISPQKTLLIFDEIQEVPRALTSLKYFAEELPEYAICCAGSLLGIALHEGTSFPVGKVDFLELRPLSFAEFLMANGETPLIEHIQRSESADSIVLLKEKLENYLKQYFVIGGMPAVVNSWVETHDYLAVQEKQEYIIETYQHDLSKHAPGNLIEKIRYVWNSIPSQLAKEQKKFVYGLVRAGARAREYEDAILWLQDAGLIHKVYRVSTPKLPLKAYCDLKSFKIFMLDVGILRVMSELPAQVVLEKNTLFEEFKGALTEQYALQELLCNREIPNCYYWTSGNTAEVDFLFAYKTSIIPLEVKSSDNTKAKSLKEYDKKFAPPLLMETSLKPFRQMNHFVNIPLYLLFNFENGYQSVMGGGFF